MGFSRQEYWSGVPFPSPGDLPDPGIKSGPPALQADCLPTELWGKPFGTVVLLYWKKKKNPCINGPAYFKTRVIRGSTVVDFSSLLSLICGVGINTYLLCRKELRSKPVAAVMRKTWLQGRSLAGVWELGIWGGFQPFPNWWYWFPGPKLVWEVMWFVLTTCFPFWSLEFGRMLGRAPVCPAPRDRAGHRVSHALLPWAALLPCRHAQQWENEVRPVWVRTPRNWSLVSSKRCPTWLFSLLILLCILLLDSQPWIRQCPPSKSLKHTWWGERLFWGLLSWFVLAAIKKEINNYRFGSLLATEIYFTQLWSWEVKDQAAAHCDFLKVLFLVWSWSLLTGPSHAGRGKGSLWVCYGGALIPFWAFL